MFVYIRSVTFDTDGASANERRSTHMIYPEFLKKNARVGITAPSCGIPEEKTPLFSKSLDNLRAYGWTLELSDNVYKCGKIASTPGDVRANEFHALIEDRSIDMVLAASGGDMLIEMLEYIDYEKISANPKWIMGYSDITGLLLPITLRCDIATVYGPNAGSFDMTELPPSLRSVFLLLEGKPQIQRSSERHERERIKGLDGYNLDTETVWNSPTGDFAASGRMLSSCIDCSSFLIGTDFAPVDRFIEKYKDDGIIWNFDNFALSAETLYYTLWNMKNAGWFKHTRAVMISRTLFESSNFDLSYCEAAQNALGDIPLVLDTDTGHVKPMMPLVNGAMTKLTVCGKGGTVEQKFC